MNITFCGSDYNTSFMNCQPPNQRPFNGVDTDPQNAIFYGVAPLMKSTCEKSPEEVDRLVDIDHEDPILKAFILFVQTADAILKYADAHFYRKAGLSVTKFVVLRILSTNGGTMKPSEIARWTLRERHNITTLVNRLERDGVVTTKRNDTDRRFVSVTLTDKGWKILRQVTPVARDIVNQAMLSTTKDDAVLLEKLLRVLRQNAHHGLEHVTKRSRPQPD